MSTPAETVDQQVDNALDASVQPRRNRQIRVGSQENPHRFRRIRHAVRATACCCGDTIDDTPDTKARRKWSQVQRPAASSAAARIA